MEKGGFQVLETWDENDNPMSPFAFLDLFEGFGALLAKAYDQRSGLTRQQSRVIRALLEKDGQTQTELANEVDQHKVSVGIYLTELESLGLVERRPHPTDRRAKRIHVTPLLRSLVQVGRDNFSDVHARAIDGIDPKDYLAMLRCVRSMRDNLARIDKDETESGD